MCEKIPPSIGDQSSKLKNYRLLYGHREGYGVKCDENTNCNVFNYCPPYKTATCNMRSITFVAPPITRVHDRYQFLSHGTCCLRHCEFESPSLPESDIFRS